MHRLGVRSSLLLNKFDNPLTGVRFDGGAFGVVINAGNRLERRHVLQRAHLHGRAARQHDRDAASPAGSAFLDSTLNALGVSSGDAARLSARAALQHPRPDRPSAATSCGG